MEAPTKEVKVTFVNYNYAFSVFYGSYKGLCMKISEKVNLQEIREIRKMISTFIYEYDYAIPDEQKKRYYRGTLGRIRDEMTNDQEMAKIFSKDMGVTKARVEYYAKYYYYLTQYLNLLGQYANELTLSYMPNTNIQKKLVRFSNNQMFFEQFMEYKKTVTGVLADFTLEKFRLCFNHLIIFYHAYSLFINVEDRKEIEDLFSAILSLYLSRESVLLLSQEGLSPMQARQFADHENFIHNALLFTNSCMNKSFSNFDILPKIQEKEYIDRTLI